MLAILLLLFWVQLGPEDEQETTLMHPPYFSPCFFVSCCPHTLQSASCSKFVFCTSFIRRATIHSHQSRVAHEGAEETRAMHAGLTKRWNGRKKIKLTCSEKKEITDAIKQTNLLRFTGRAFHQKQCSRTIGEFVWSCSFEPTQFEMDLLDGR